MCLCASAAIVFMVEADGERRKLGLPSRVTFLNKSSTEAEHQFNSTLDLRGQKKKKVHHDNGQSEGKRRDE